jgi:ankyrin repeat protein
MKHLQECDHEKMRPIDWAARSGSVNILEYLIRMGLDIYNNNDSGKSVLYYAVKEDRYEAARFLLKCGCSPYGTIKGIYFVCYFPIVL